MEDKERDVYPLPPFPKQLISVIYLLTSSKGLYSRIRINIQFPYLSEFGDQILNFKGKSPWENSFFKGNTSPLQSWWDKAISPNNGKMAGVTHVDVTIALSKKGNEKQRILRKENMFIEVFS